MLFESAKVHEFIVVEYEAIVEQPADEHCNASEEILGSVRRKL